MSIRAFIKIILGKLKSAKTQKGLRRDKASQDIERRLSAMEEKQQEIERLLAEKYWTIDKIVIENMYTDKLEFNLDTIDVDELSGMLSIGINSEGKLVKMGYSDVDKIKEEKPKETKIKFIYDDLQENRPPDRG